LRRLGARLRRPARLYLVGGTTMVFEALRPQTLDIDVVLEVSPEVHGELIQAIRALKDELSINVEAEFTYNFHALEQLWRERRQPGAC
jgi:hypothetical protein